MDKGLKVRLIREKSKHYKRKCVVRKVYLPKHWEDAALADLELLEEDGTLSSRGGENQ